MPYPSSSAVFPSRRLAAGLMFASLALAGCGQAPVAPDCTDVAYPVRDPAVGVNRKIFVFNKGVDDYLFQPIARGYTHLPEVAQRGIHNFSSNLGEPRVLVNDLLQGNLRRSLNTVGRFGLNTTLGLLGVFDVASRVGMPPHRADFGQTFGVWGAGSGPTVELPLLGTSSVRDGIGIAFDLLLDPLGGAGSDTVQRLNTVAGIGRRVDGRAEALPVTDRLEQGPDYYAALRDWSAQKRAQRVLEGRHGALESCRAPVP